MVNDRSPRPFVKAPPPTVVGARARARSAAESGSPIALAQSLVGLPDDQKFAVIISRLEDYERRFGDGSESFDEFRRGLSDMGAWTGDTMESLHVSFTEALRETKAEAKAASAAASQAMASAAAAAAPKPKQIPWLGILGLVGSLSIVAFQAAWSASRYPDRGEFNDLTARMYKVESNVVLILDRVTRTEERRSQP